ncbi:MAG: hypothetical protein PF484_01515 [Bacteroidales bacterium]|jgi:hypothetical protein|nr:hypothetical protein [Bacteroidales bacterium]
MIILRLIPIILSFLLLGAHFSRDSQPLLMTLAIAFPFLLFIKKAWIPKLFQITLILGALEWLRSLYFYLISYDEMGKDSTKLILIIGSVTLFTFLSALVFKYKAVRDKYN